MSNDRVKNYRLRQKSLGRFKREMYLTGYEFDELKEKLKELRERKKEPKNE